jgi:hypothetical protein
MSESLHPLTPAAAGNALAAASSNLPELDAHGHEPAHYDWVPVLRKRRADGWSPSVQRRFIEVLADNGSVAQAARAVGMSESSCYQLRRAPGAESFAAAWRAAIDEASKRLIDAAFERALVGSDEPVFDRAGNRVGRRFRQSDRMLMFLLRAYMPERFGASALDRRKDDGDEHFVSPPVAKALERLLPETPAAPHLLLTPDDLDIALQVADILDGALPRRYQDAGSDGPTKPDRMPMGEAFERSLEDAKREGAGEPPLSDDEWAVHRNMLLG